MTTTTAEISLPEGASFPRRMRVAFDALRILEKDPGHPIAGPVFNACIDISTYQKLIGEMQHTEQGQRLLQHRPSLQGPDLNLDELAKMPKGSLGRATADYFRENQLDPFVTAFEIRNDVDFISKRYRETHDIFHVVTGYGTDVVGEMELQAFVMGNLGIRSPLMILLYSVGPIRKEAGGMSWREYLRRLRRAYRHGRSSSSLLDFPFEEHWLTPVARLREQLCPLPGSEAAQP